jgi:hypothetical protein
VRDQAGLQTEIEADGRQDNQQQLTMWQYRHQEHQGKREGDQRRAQLSDPSGAKFIGQSARQRRGQRPGCTGDTKAPATALPM